MAFTPFKARDLEQVGPFVFTLGEMGVELPDGVADANDRLLRIHAFRPNANLIAQRAMALDEQGMRQLMIDVGVAHALEGSGGPGDRAVDTIRRALQEQIAEALLERAEDVLGQMRPAFDYAGELVHEAVKIGIHANTTDRDIVKADRIEEMRDAWTSLPGLVATLDQIASMRIALSRATGAPPEPSVGTHYAYADHSDPAIGAMFHPAAPRWREDFEQTWQMWLRLCQGEPVRLLSLEDSQSAAAGDPPKASTPPASGRATAGRRTAEEKKVS